MAADDDGKTEEPTAKKLSDAREQGNVPKSNDLTSAVAILAMAGILWLFGAKTGEKLGNLMRDSFALIATFEVAPTNLVDMLGSLGIKVLWILLPITGTLAIISLTAQFLQTDFNVSTKTLKPNFKQVFGLAGLKRLFSSEAWIELVKSLLKMALVAVIGYHVVSRHYFEYLRTADQSIRQILSLVGSVTIEIFWKCGLLLIFIGVGDFLWQRRRWKTKLKMTKQEVKDEAKSSEGDPQIKGKIKRLRQEMHRNMMMHEMPKATVVITNPTFIAIALRYTQGVDQAPVVVAKGKRLIAERIRDTAREHNIPIVEDKPVARGLYDLAEIGAPIPAEFFAAVAEILAYVIGLKGKGTASTAA
jgi:flagellar biosynthetic protein FlhB